MSETRCCIKGCSRTGIPSNGYDFFVCDDCCRELDRRIRKLMTKEEYVAFDAYWEKSIKEAQ